MHSGVVKKTDTAHTAQNEMLNFRPLSVLTS